MFNSDTPENRVEGELLETWQRFVQGLLAVLALVGALVMAHYYAPPETSGLEQQVHQLSRQVADLERQQSVSAAAVDDARDSVAYIYGIYHVAGHAQGFRARVSGTGFVVAPGLLATNRHVAEPWYVKDHKCFGVQGESSVSATQIQTLNAALAHGPRHAGGTRERAAVGHLQQDSLHRGERC